MARLSYGEIRDTLRSMVASGPERGYTTTEVLSDDVTWLGTWATHNIYVLVQAMVVDPGLGRTLIDVHAGGAHGCHPSPALWQTVASSSWRCDYGGPWARLLPGPTAAFGWRGRYPSDLFHQENLPDAFGFVLGMVEIFGQTAAALAAEMIPQFGGYRCLAGDETSWGALLAGMLPQDELRTD